MSRLAAVFVAAVVGAAVPLSGAADTAVPGAARVARSVAYLELPAPVPGLRVAGASGTGFVVASNATASYVVTAAHVLSCDTYGNGCRPQIAVRAAGSANAVMADLVFAGATNEREDYAIVRVPVGGLPAVALSAARAGEAVGLVGYPQVADASGGQTPTPPKLVPAGGTVTRLDQDDKVLVMNIDTSRGDSGGPIFDATSGAVLGIVHGAIGATADVERSAVTVAVVRDVIAEAARAAAGGSGSTDARMRAKVLYAYAQAAHKRCETLQAATEGSFGTVDQVDKLCALARSLLVAAVEAGSLDAAIEITQADHIALFNTLLNKDAVLTSVQRAALGGDDNAASSLISHYAVDFHRAGTNAAAAAAAAAKVWQVVNAAASHGVAVQMARLSIFFDLAAKGHAKEAGTALFDAFDPSWDLGADKDKAAATDWGRRAEAPLQQRIAAGDSDAALVAAAQVELSPIGQDLSNVAIVAGAYLKAIALGSDAALQHIGSVSSIITGPMQREVLQALQKAFNAGKRGDYAMTLGRMYAQGEGTTVDKHQALLAYRAAGDNPLIANLRGLVPDGDEIAATLAATPGYRAALTSGVRLTVPSPDGGSDTLYGVVVQSGGGNTIVATAAFNLGCDSWADACRLPSRVEFANGTRSTAIHLVRPADTSIENGVALLQVDGVAIPAATIADTLPETVVTACSQARWGPFLSATPDRRVVDLAVPYAGALGCGLFDLRSGHLVGVYTDPVLVFNATGPATIVKALHEMHPQ